MLRGVPVFLQHGLVCETPAVMADAYAWVPDVRDDANDWPTPASSAGGGQAAGAIAGTWADAGIWPAAFGRRPAGGGGCHSPARRIRLASGAQGSLGARAHHRELTGWTPGWQLEAGVGRMGVQHLGDWRLEGWFQGG